MAVVSYELYNSCGKANTVSVSNAWPENSFSSLANKTLNFISTNSAFSLKLHILMFSYKENECHKLVLKCIHRKF